jgi:ParB family chromosome partitioning protein
MAAKHGLGRGLNALIRDTPVPAVADGAGAKGGILQVEPARIKPSPWQPRRHFDRQALSELAQSITAHGVLEPLLVRKVEDGYELIAGERRWRAAGEAGLTQVPVIVVEATDHQALELALIENLQREDLNVIEEAEGYRLLADKFGLTQEEIAQRVNKARASVANALRLLGLPEEVRKFIAEGLLSSGHAKVLLGLAIAEEQCRLAERVIQDGLSVRDLERLVDHLKRLPRKKRESREDMPASHVTYLTDRLHQHFGTAVHIQPCRTLGNGRKVKGQLTIDFFSNDDLDRVLELVGIVEK